MKRIIFCLTAIAVMAASPLFAQADFRSASSGVWTDSQNWEENESGVWLQPASGIYPGERHNRDANVTINDGSTLTVGKDEVVQINSLSIFDGRVVVEGTLIVGPSVNDPSDQATDSVVTPNTDPIIITDNGSPLLLQNVPNPLAPQFGYETTIKFFLDKQYPNARLTIYDQLGHIVQEVYQEQNPSIGWHTIRARLDHIQSGTYPLLLELPGNILRRMVTVLR